MTPEQAIAYLMRRKTPDDIERLNQLCARKHARRAARGQWHIKAAPLFADLPPEVAHLAMRFLNLYLSRPKNRDAMQPGKGWKFAALCGAARQQAMWRFEHPGKKFGMVNLWRQQASNRAKRVLGLLPPKEVTSAGQVA